MREQSSGHEPGLEGIDDAIEHLEMLIVAGGDQPIPDLLQMFLVELRLWHVLGLLDATGVDELVILEQADVEAIMPELLWSMAAEVVTNSMAACPLRAPEHLLVAAWHEALGELHGHLYAIVGETVEWMREDLRFEVGVDVLEDILRSQRQEAERALIDIALDDAGHAPLEGVVDGLP